MEATTSAELVDKKQTLIAGSVIQSAVPIEAVSTAATTAISANQIDLENSAAATTTTTTDSTSPATTSATGTADNRLTVDQLDIAILPVIYDILRCVEKDPKDQSAKQRESHEVFAKIAELNKRFESAREQIRQLPGIDYNPEEQLQQLETLRLQLALKQQLIRKYKNKQF